MVADPLMLTLTRRMRTLTMTVIHHAFVTAFSVAIVSSSHKTDCQMYLLVRPLMLISMERASLYASVLFKRARPVAAVLVTFQFVGLLLTSALGDDEICGTLHAQYTRPCQFIFVFVFLACNAYIKVKDVGVLLAFRPTKPDDDPRLVPLWIPTWARQTFV